MPSARDVRVLSRLGRGIVLVLAGRRPNAFARGKIVWQTRLRIGGTVVVRNVDGEHVVVHGYDGGTAVGGV